MEVGEEANNTAFDVFSSFHGSIAIINTPMAYFGYTFRAIPV